MVYSDLEGFGLVACRTGLMRSRVAKQVWGILKGGEYPGISS